MNNDITRRISITIFSIFYFISFSCFASENLDQKIDNLIPGLYKTYQNLHSAPELSLMEKNTSKKLAKELKKLGFAVTENFGGYGVVGILKNGEGPVVMIRTDMDALPIKEETGLDYKSNVVTLNKDGQKMPAMHACGHDMHMTVWLGVSEIMARSKNDWHGTLMMIAQPAEEVLKGANLMLQNGLYSSFPKPNYALALHVIPNIASGKVGYRSGYVMANSNALNIEVYGIGGHGAMPDKTIDPIVLSAKIILDLQTIVSRVISPLDPSVVTVGSINGGSKHNIIPDTVKLQLTIRSYKDEVKEKIMASIKRITEGNAMAAGIMADKYPKISYIEGSPALYNNPILQDRLIASFTKAVGKENIVDSEPVMGAEDFALYGRTSENVPIAMFRLGIGDPQKIAAKEQIPGLHSALLKIYDPELVIKTGIKSMSQAAMDLMKI